MSKFTIKLDKRKLQGMQARIGQFADAWSEETANEVKTDIRARWSGHYPPASMPGEPPAIRTGTLDLSIEVEKTRRAGFGVWSIVAKTAYAAALEWGAPARRLAARPFLRPAAERARLGVRQRVANLFYNYFR